MTFSGTHLTAMDAPLLGVNIDHVATVRNARGGRFPDPVAAAQLAVEGGADIITFHLREDRRHIRDDDVVRLKASIAVPLNFEAAITDEMLDTFAVSGRWGQLPEIIRARYGDLLDRVSYYLPFEPGANDTGWRNSIDGFRRVSRG